MGILAGISMSGGTRFWLLWGTAFLHAAFILDNCDGELARSTSRRTAFGARYDLLTDLAVDCSVWIGLGFGAVAVYGPASWHGWAAAACLGSVCNQIMVIWERRKNQCTSIHSESNVKRERKKNVLLSVLDYFSHNGDSIILAWIMALIGDAALILTAGCIYIQGLWIGRLWSHRKALLSD
jgi:phosphatidylglycerophosphate synthase